MIRCFTLYCNFSINLQDRYVPKNSNKFWSMTWLGFARSINHKLVWPFCLSSGTSNFVSCVACCLYVFFFFLFFFSIHTDVQLFSRFSFLLLFFHFKSNIIVVLVIVQIFKQINSCWLNIWRQCEFIATPRASAFYLRRNLSRFDPAYHCVLVSAARLFCHFKFSFFSLFRKLKNIEKL